MVLELFFELSKIPRCSFNKEPFVAYLEQKSEEYGYLCLVDSAKNILCKKENSNANLAMQAHYDMVCLEENKLPSLMIEEGFIKAVDSTLGADNGIGCAYMLYFMAKGYDVEFLFTSDEEVGLIGANHLNHPLHATTMINLDSEDDKEICIGCAGGVDIFGTFTKKHLMPKGEYQLYEMSIDGLAGGHSGVDIDKNIPNAIALISHAIFAVDGLVLDIHGGERINSIPKSTRAIIAAKTPPKSLHPLMKIALIEGRDEHLSVFDPKLLEFLARFNNGVLAFNSELNVVQTSINLAKIKTDTNGVLVEMSARSMDNIDLKNLEDRVKYSLIESGFVLVESVGKYPSWKPSINSFTTFVLEIFKKYEPNVQLKAIHAGLECAVIGAKYPNMMITSIGPNIFNPHSNSERVEIASVEKVFVILKEIVEKMK